MAIKSSTWILYFHVLFTVIGPRKEKLMHCPEPPLTSLPRQNRRPHLAAPLPLFLATSSAPIYRSCSRTPPLFRFASALYLPHSHPASVFVRSPSPLSLLLRFYSVFFFFWLLQQRFAEACFSIDLLKQVLQANQALSLICTSALSLTTLLFSLQRAHGLFVSFASTQPCSPSVDLVSLSRHSASVLIFYFLLFFSAFTIFPFRFLPFHSCIMASLLALLHPLPLVPFYSSFSLRFNFSFPFLFHLSSTINRGVTSSVSSFP